MPKFSALSQLNSLQPSSNARQRRSPEELDNMNHTNPFASQSHFELSTPINKWKLILSSSLLDPHFRPLFAYFHTPTWIALLLLKHHKYFSTKIRKNCQKQQMIIVGQLSIYLIKFSITAMRKFHQAVILCKLILIISEQPRPETEVLY